MDIGNRADAHRDRYQSNFSFPANYTAKHFYLVCYNIPDKWKYLYRAVDSAGNTIDFMLSAKRDRRAAKQFFRKALKTAHTYLPGVINIDKNTVYPITIKYLQAGATLPQACELRQNKYLNNLVEQDHRSIKKLVNPGLAFKSFHTARRMPIGYETMNSIRKNQLLGVSKGDILGQVKFIAHIFGVFA